MGRSLFSAVCIVLFLSFPVYAENDNPKIALLISSSNSDSSSLDLAESFIREWQKNGDPVTLISQRLPITGTEAPSAELCFLTQQVMMERLRENPPDIILAHLNDALDLAVVFRDTNYPEVPILSLEVTELQYEEYTNTPRLYWVRMPRHDLANIRLAHQVLPWLKRVIIFLHFPEPPEELEQVYTSELHTIFPETSFHLLVNPTIEKADALLKEKRTDTAVINLNPGWLIEDGRFLTGKEFISDIVNRYDVPVFEFLRQDLGDGLLGGAGFTRANLGKAAAEISKKILIEHEQFPPTIDWPGLESYFIDYKVLIRYGSGLKHVPEGSEIINLPPSFWVRYKRPIQLFAFSMIILIIILLFNLRGKHQEQRLLSAKNKELEHTVSKRTKELKTSNEELSAMNSNLVSTLQRMESMQGDLIQKEREALLGRLTTGIAHELNSPLAAIRAANESQRYTLLQKEENLQTTLLTLTPAQRKLFTALQNRISSTTGETDTLSGDIKTDSLIYKAPPEVMEELIFSGLATIEVDMLNKLMRKENRNLVSALYQLSILFRSIAIIESATERSNLVITTIREYISLQDQQVQKDHIDVQTSLETALNDLQDKWPESVYLIKRFTSIQKVLAVESLLKRVWIHITRNALQAMPEGGTLTVSLKTGEGYVQAIFSDTGIGIDAAIENRLFEPFITTKPYAEGIGLGLANCKKILEIMDGSITYKKKKKGTSFIVTLKTEV